MRLEKEQDLLRHLKEDACLPVYLLYGQQSYLVRLYAKKLREKAVPPSLMDLNFTYFEASRTGVDEVSDALESISFSGGTRCVQLTDLDADKLSAAEWAKWKERLSAFPEDTVLILSQQNIPVDPKKSSRWRRALPPGNRAVFNRPVPKKRLHHLPCGVRVPHRPMRRRYAGAGAGGPKAVRLPGRGGNSRFGGGKALYPPAGRQCVRLSPPDSCQKPLRCAGKFAGTV